jgi:hypothetical protein
MNIDSSPPSRLRKRRITDNNNDDDDDINTNKYNSPSKRLQSSHGLPIARKIYHLNAHLIFNSLALTRLRVTSNFSLYNPPTSPVLINVTRSDDALYRLLWSVPTPRHIPWILGRTIKILTTSPLRPPIPLPPLSNPPKSLRDARGTDFFRSVDSIPTSRSDMHDCGFG